MDSESKPKRNYDKKVHGKRYSLARKLAIKARYEMGESPTVIAREEGVNPTTVYDVMKDKKISKLAPNVVEDIKKSLVGMKYANAYRAQEKVSEQKLDAMNAYQLTLISSINVDKARLMENLSTENIAHRGFLQSATEAKDKLMAKFSGLLDENV